MWSPPSHWAPSTPLWVAEVSHLTLVGWEPNGATSVPTTTYSSGGAMRLHQKTDRLQLYLFFITRKKLMGASELEYLDYQLCFQGNRTQVPPPILAFSLVSDGRSCQVICGCAVKTNYQLHRYAFSTCLTPFASSS